MKEVSIYLASEVRSIKKGSGYVAYCLEYYLPRKKEPEILIDEEYVEGMTGKAAELEVLIRALGRLDEKQNFLLSIYTESQYIAMGIGERMLIGEWHKNSWKNSKNVAVKNKGQWLEIAKRLKGNHYRICLNEPNAYVKMLHARARKRNEDVKEGNVRNRGVPMGDENKGCETPADTQTP